jgi:hypothetical protein
VKFPPCSMYRNTAVWGIDNEVFCEGHKEAKSRSSESITSRFVDRVRSYVPWPWRLLRTKTK